MYESVRSHMRGWPNPRLSHSELLDREAKLSQQIAQLQREFDSLLGSDKNHRARLKLADKIFDLERKLADVEDLRMSTRWNPQSYPGARRFEDDSRIPQTRWNPLEIRATLSDDMLQESARFSQRMTVLTIAGLLLLGAYGVGQWNK